MALVRLEAHGGVRLITLDDPDRRNLLSAPLCAELSDTLAQVEADPESTAIVITGAGSAFCAGADLADLQAAAAGKTEPLYAVYRSFIEVADCKLPTIAAVNGPAVGAGLNLALACDMRLSSESAWFDCRFLKLGLHQGGGHGWMLLRAVGWAQAVKMLCLDRRVQADEALRTGLVQAVHDAPSLLDEAMALARATDALPRDLVMRAKATLRHAATATHAEAFERETEQQLRSLGEPPFLELVRKVEAQISRRDS